MSKKQKQKKNHPPSPAVRTPRTAIHTVTETRLETFTGPLPKPEILAQYDRIVPGAANRIIRMAEDQLSHRQFLEKTVISGDTTRSKQGLWVGGGIAFLFLVGSVFLIYNGHDWAGVALGSIDVVGLVGAFIYGTASRRAERIRKAAIMTPKRQD